MAVLAHGRLCHLHELDAADDLRQTTEKTRKEPTMKKTVAEFEIAKGASDDIYRKSLAEVTKAIQRARAARKGRITVKVEQGE